MKSEFFLRLADLALPGLPAGPITSVESQRKVIRAIEDEYQLFRRIGELVVTLEGELVRVAFTSDDRINPIDVAISELQAGRVSEGIELLQFLYANSPDDPNVLYLLVKTGILAHYQHRLAEVQRIHANIALGVDDNAAVGRLQAHLAGAFHGQALDILQLTDAGELLFCNHDGRFLSAQAQNKWRQTNRLPVINALYGE